MGKSMVVRNSNGRSHHILENIFLTCGASKCLGMHAQAITHPLLPFSSPILLHVGFLHAVEVLCVLSFMFFSFPSFLHAQKFVLALFSTWERNIYVFTTFWWFLPCLGIVFTLLSGQEARNPFLGFITIVLGSCIAIDVFRKQKTRIGFLQRSILALGSH